jgi:hypothetical protein
MRFRYRRLFAAGFLAAWMAAPASVAAQGAGGSFPLQVEAVHAVGLEENLGSVLAGVVAEDGRVYVVDHVNAHVLAYSPEGRLLWRRGRKGAGPGEFQIPYRLAVGRDGRVYVYDHATGAVSVLSADGDFAARMQLPVRFHAVDSFLAHADGGLLISGIVDDNRPAPAHGVHRFVIGDGEIAHRGSFGPVPSARDPFVLRYWGAGAMARASDGGILFALRLPYEVVRFDRALVPGRVLRPPFRLDGAPDDALQIERSPGRMSVALNPVQPQRPGALAEVFDGWVLVSRLSGDGPKYWDLFAPSGAYVGTRSIPAEWMGILGYDASRGLLWMGGTMDDAPVLLRLRIARATEGGAQRSPGSRR